MSESAITIAMYLGSLYGMLKVIDWAFDQDDVVKKTTRKRLGTWLRNLDFGTGVASWPDGFLELFDGWFGEKHWSWRCFRISSLISIFGVLIFHAIYFLRNPGTLNQFTQPGDVFLGIVSALLINVVGDYGSLLETRYLLGKVELTFGILRLISILVLDIILTTLIVFVMYTIFRYVAAQYLFGLGTSNFQLLFELNASIAVFTDVNTWTLTHQGRFTESLGCYIYTTFVTSVWLWLYASASYLVKLIGQTRIGVHFLQHHLDLENKPFKSIGKAAQILIVAGYLIAVPFIFF